MQISGGHYYQWCTLHGFSEQQILGRFVFHLRYFGLPPLSKSNSVNLKEAFLVRFGKTRNNFDIDELDIKQQLDETAEEYISRIQQLACDEDIPPRMLVNLIAKGFKPEIAETVWTRKPSRIYLESPREQNQPEKLQN